MSASMAAQEPRLCRLGNTFLNWKCHDFDDVGASKRARSHPGYRTYDDVVKSAYQVKLTLAQGVEELEEPTPAFREPGAQTPIGMDVSPPTPTCAHEEEVASASILPHENVTTLMIRNMPGNITQKFFMDTLDADGFSGLYDFVHIPYHYGTQFTKRYAFVNFVTPMVAADLLQAWQKTFRFGRSKMPLNISPGCVQGLEANVAAWSRAKLRRIKNPAYRPWVRLTDARGASSCGFDPLLSLPPATATPDVAEDTTEIDPFSTNLASSTLVEPIRSPSRFLACKNESKESPECVASVAENNEADEMGLNCVDQNIVGYFCYADRVGDSFQFNSIKALSRPAVERKWTYRTRARARLPQHSSICNR